MGSGPYSTLCVWSCCIEERGHLPLLRNDVLSHISSQSGVSSAPWVKTHQHTQAQWYYKKTNPNAPVLLHQHTLMNSLKSVLAKLWHPPSARSFSLNKALHVNYDERKPEWTAQHIHPPHWLWHSAQLILRPALFLSKHYCTDFTVQQLTCGFSCRNILL